MMAREIRHGSAMLVALMCAALLPGSSDAVESRPNLLFILADDLGWSDTTLYGTTQLYQTPHLQRLAQRGMLFTRAYAASPLCSPTRASILTGQSPARIGITAPVCHLPEVRLQATVRPAAPPTAKVLMCESASRLETSYVTLARRLKEAGYATGHFGKWHLGPEPYSPLQHGFDVDVPHHPGPGPAGSYVAPWKFRNFSERTAGEHIEARMADEAVAFLEKHQDRPFFLNYWQFSVHAPFDAKQSLVEKHRLRVQPVNPQRSPTYAAMVESLDDAVGTLLDALDRLGLAERTAVIFFSDNGGNMYSPVDGTCPTSNAPLRGGKATVFEGGVRVPCIVSWPGVTSPGSRSDALIQSVDFYPTILNLLGLPATENHPLDGADFTPALRGQAFERDAIFTYFPHQPQVPDNLPPCVTVHRGDWKLIRLFHEGDGGHHAYQLYNLREDLGEQHDWAADKPDLVRELDARIERFLQETAAVTPQPNPRYGTAPDPRPAATDDPLQGWKARGCTAVVEDGILIATPQNSAPFLGFAAGRHVGPATVTVRLRCLNDAEGRIDWLPGGVADKPRSVPYQVAGGEWQQLRIALPAEGPLGIVRVYLPAPAQPVQIDWIEIRSARGAPTRNDF